MSMILLIALVAVGGWLAASMVHGAWRSRRRDATADFSRALVAMSPSSSGRRDPRRSRARAGASPRPRSRR